MSGPRIVLLAPGFHGYARSIARGFEDIGTDIAVHEYDRLDGFAAKLRHKAGVELPAKLLRRPDPGVQAGKQTAAFIRSHRPDIVLIIRGDALSEEVHDAITQVGARPILWLWDEVRRTRHTEASLDRYDQLISYSPLDTEAFMATGRSCVHVANAFDPSMTPALPRHGNRLLFIGARYPRRQELLEALAAASVPTLAVGRDWSRHPMDRARTWQWARPAVPSTRDADRLTGYAMTAGAPGAINIHGDQDGFTMKTFEAPGVGGVQLVDRADVDQFYEPGTEVLVFDGAEELIDLGRRLIRDDRWGDRIRAAGQARTLAEHTFAHRARQVAELWA